MVWYFRALLSELLDKYLGKRVDAEKLSIPKRYERMKFEGMGLRESKQQMYKKG